MRSLLRVTTTTAGQPILPGMRLNLSAPIGATTGPWAAEGDLPIAGDFETEGAAPAPSGDALSPVSVTQTSDREADVVISYIYSGGHGPVYVGARPTQGGVRVANFEFRRAGIAAAGIEVFMFISGGTPDEPFAARRFSRGLTWGCGGGYVGSYRRILTHRLGTVAPSVEHRLMMRISAARGVETLVLRAATASGRVLQDACGFSIAGVSKELARVWTDKGCGAEAAFHHRERATIYYSVDAPVTCARIYAINPKMGLVELTTAPLTGQSGQLELTVGPQLGDAVLVAAAVTPTQGVVTSSCWVLME